jgi:hypothetical protein
MTASYPDAEHELMMKKIFLSILLITVVVIPAVLSSCEEASFEVTGLVIEPESVMAGETVDVSVTVNNVGGSDGIYDVVLKVDGEQITNELIALAGGTDKTVTLSVKVPYPGEHLIEIAGLSGNVSVIDLDEIMAKSLEAISGINSYHFTCILEIEMSLPEDSLSLFEELGEFEELP